VPPARGKECLSLLPPLPLLSLSPSSSKGLNSSKHDNNKMLKNKIMEITDNKTKIKVVEKNMMIKMMITNNMKM
jgi:hypothetical protein